MKDFQVTPGINSSFLTIRFANPAYNVVDIFVHRIGIEELMDLHAALVSQPYRYRWSSTFTGFEKNGSMCIVKAINFFDDKERSIKMPCSLFLDSLTQYITMYAGIENSRKNPVTPPEQERHCEMFYLDANNNFADEKDAVKFVIRVTDGLGHLVDEIWGAVNKDRDPGFASYPENHSWFYDDDEPSMRTIYNSPQPFFEDEPEDIPMACVYAPPEVMMRDRTGEKSSIWPFGKKK